MAARKLQQEVDKCFKKVAEGVAEFETIYEKIELSNNPAQKEKLEDNLKREIKKLQRLRDQIKTWAASNDIKDKSPLLEHRRLIETQMEKFKAVEKAMKTKAYSKEGLAAAKLDPKEQAKVEAGEFLSTMIDELEQQVETLEAESESLSATMKKGKQQNAKAERMAEIEEFIEKHKWHQGKLELIRRSLENGGVEADSVNDLEESIRYYVSDGMNPDYIGDDDMYDELDLEDEEGTYGMGQDENKDSSQDGQSVQEDVLPEALSRKVTNKDSDSGRKPSAQTKSPLPALATLHTTPPVPTVTTSSNGSMKPAVAPARPTEGLKYASAAAAAAASDKSYVGISPLPPPPGSQAMVGISPLPPVAGVKTSASNSPATAHVQPAPLPPAQSQPVTDKHPSPPAAAPSEPDVPEPVPKPVRKLKAAGKQPVARDLTETTRGQTNGVKATPAQVQEEESIYHLPASLQDLVASYESSRSQSHRPTSPSTLRLMSASQNTLPSELDAEAPRTYRPEIPAPPSALGFPREPLPMFEDTRMYSKMDVDTLFYVFYYKQGTTQQFQAAKALKDQSWRFHKQYQTWFQRHEEPKNITEEFEQGTYRFFDYESTWMNRRKADFKFAYKFLEDEV